jgi:glycerol-3-phosphate acyltransferase PlsY
MNYLLTALFILIGYLFGSLNFSIIIGKLFYKTDVREYGSKNAGATNTLRTLGNFPAACVLVLDALKGVIAYYSALTVTKDLNAAYFAAAFAVLGHNYPVFFGFRGGKGVTTSLGAVMCMNFPLSMVILGIAVAVFIITRYISAGSIIAAAAAVTLFAIFDNTPVKLIITAFLVVLLIARHSGNIKRLLNGTENKFSFK